MPNSHAKISAHFRSIIEELNSRRERQLEFLSEVDRRWLDSVRGHLIEVAYPGETFQSLGCRPGTPPEIAERMTTLIADTVVEMVVHRLQPAYLPMAVADALAARNFDQRADRVTPYYPVAHAWGRIH